MGDGSGVTVALADAADADPHAAGEPAVILAQVEYIVLGLIT
jgi:hypothetical protein